MTPTGPILDLCSCQHSIGQHHLLLVFRGFAGRRHVEVVIP